jgi:nitroreductase
MELTQVIKERKSVRVFKNEEIQLEIIEEVVSLALNAPSAINLQPWEFYIVYGEEKNRLGRVLLKAYKEKQISCGPGTDKPLPDVYRQRGIQAAESMEPFLKELGIPFNKFINEGSCNFYGAPVAIIICIDNCFPKTRFLDIGIVFSYLLLAAYDHKLATCPVGLILSYENEIKEFLNIPDNKSIAIGVAIGYPDPDNPLSKYKSTRDTMDKFIHWVG